MSRYAPLAILALLVALLGAGLTRNPRELPSPLIGKPAPDFALARIAGDPAAVTPASLRGEIWLLNVWASWCATCRDEMGALQTLAAERSITLVGLNHKDDRDAATRWLARYGDPYTLNLFDGTGRVGMDFGVYAVPETFIVDGRGIIRYKHIGALTPEILRRDILPLVGRLRGETRVPVS